MSKNSKPKPTKNADEPKESASEKLVKALAKTEAITFRLSHDDKAAMQATAHRLRLTVSEYILRLHQYAGRKLSAKKKGG